MSTKSRQSRQIICELCGKKKTTPCKYRDICRSCYKQEPSTKCPRCGRLTHQAAQNAGFCPKCTEIATRPEAICRKCNRVKVIHNQSASICKSCHELVSRSARKAKQDKVKCSNCGELHSSVLVNRAICFSCWLEEHNGKKLCEVCNKQKVIASKTECLCKHCLEDRRSPEVLCKYITNFTTDYPYNKLLFDLLVSEIKWKEVKTKDKQRFYTFGHFLQTYQLPQPLSWEAIEEAMPKLKSTNRFKPKIIRSCLLDLGHLLASRGQLESLDVYQARRQALRTLSQAPEYIQPILNRFATWLWNQQMKPTSVRHYMENLSMFWSWCSQHGIQSPAQVQPSLVNNYLQMLYWQWQCSECQAISEFDPYAHQVHEQCTHCGAVSSLTKVKQYSQSTVCGRRSGLRVFFDWAKINKLVLFNPVQRQIKLPDQKILHYPFEVIEQLSRYIINPEADPTEALTLYLIIFHGFTSWELRYTKISEVIPLRDDILLSTLAEAYYLVVPRPPVSRGRHSPGRPSARLNFPPVAAAWLKPLLERFEHQRQQRLSNPNNRYLLVAPGRTRHDKPICYEYLRRILQRASLCVIGADCTPKTLRITAGVMYTDRAGRGILEWMGWGEKQAFFYGWGPREVIYPQRINKAQDKELQLSVEPTDFPSTREISLSLSHLPHPL